MQPVPHPLARIDPGLLVALHVLLEERNVTRAARRLGVTQSAVSHKLRRLREHFDDPLLVPGHRGSVLTERPSRCASRISRPHPSSSQSRISRGPHRDRW